MRPVYIRKMKRKINKKKLSKTKSKFYGGRSILKSDIDKINKILHNRKLELARGRGTWKVMPKDSCEVYRERRQRQLVRKKQWSERDSDKSYSQTENRITKRPSRKGKSSYKPRQRGLKRRQLSTCSCCSSQTYCTCSESDTYSS